MVSEGAEAVRKATEIAGCRRAMRAGKQADDGLADKGVRPDALRCDAFGSHQCRDRGGVPSA